MLAADGEGIAMNELHIAIVEALAGRLEEARTLVARALAVYASVGFHHYAAECLETASIVANGEDTPEEAAFLLGVATRLRDECRRAAACRSWRGSVNARPISPAPRWASIGSNALTTEASDDAARGRTSARPGVPRAGARSQLKARVMRRRTAIAHLLNYGTLAGS